jgi:hypothetical protein
MLFIASSVHGRGSVAAPALALDADDGLVIFAYTSTRLPGWR